MLGFTLNIRCKTRAGVLATITQVEARLAAGETSGKGTIDKDGTYDFAEIGPAELGGGVRSHYKRGEDQHVTS